MIILPNKGSTMRTLYDANAAFWKNSEINQGSKKENYELYGARTIHGHHDSLGDESAGYGMFQLHWSRFLLR